MRSPLEVERQEVVDAFVNMAVAMIKARFPKWGPIVYRQGEFGEYIKEMEKKKVLVVERPADFAASGSGDDEI